MAITARLTSLWWVVFVGLAARVLLVLSMAPAWALQPCEQSVIAANLNAGRGLVFEQYGAVYHAWKEPLHIVLLAWLTRWIGEQPLAILIFQSVCGVGTAIGIALLARRLLGDATKGLVAGLIVAVNPFLLYYDTHVIHPLSFDSLLFVATVSSVLAAISTGWPSTLRAGLTMGAALWQRATLLAAGAAMWVGAILVTRGRRRTLAVHAIVWGCVAIAVVSPWLMRNYRLFGRVVFTTDAAHILWLGNNPWSNGTYSDVEGRRVFYVADPALQRKIQGASELDQHDIFLQEVQRFIKEHPARVGALVLTRLGAFVWFSPNAGVEYARWQQRAYRSAYLVLLALGVIGFVRCWRRVGPAQRRVWLILLASVLGLATLHAITAINLKHRVPLELLLAICAAESLCEGGRWVMARRS